MNGLLRFLTCGSVDDGKSTLIGRLLYDAKLLFADQRTALELDSRRGSQDGDIDYALLLDGLSAEREQGITIDVAYRYFTTSSRSFIAADTPGHEQYTRNMAVGAAFSDAAVILVDARQGMLPQTRRHARICALMGIRHLILAVNKMDLVSYNQRRFQSIEEAFTNFADRLDVSTIQAIPVSASQGDNVTEISNRMPWYAGQPFLTTLEKLETGEEMTQPHFVMPVQRVSRPDHTFRGYQGQVESGTIHQGDTVILLPSGEEARVKRILASGVEETAACSGQPVTILLDREVDVSRGCVLTTCEDLAVADMFTATLLWMDDTHLVEGRNYLLKLGTKTTPATVMRIKYRIDVHTGDGQSTDCLFKNEMARCDVALSEPMVFDAFRRTRNLGSFILIDRLTHMTAACGVVEHPLRRSTNVVWQPTDITRSIRARQKNQTPLTIWMTGLSGSGKSTLANEVEKRLVAAGKHTMLLDGDNIRHGLNKNLGFREVDRVENIRRIAEVAKLMNDAGLIVLAAFISPYASDRENARNIIGSDHFIEIHVSTPLDVCEDRDTNGLYEKARAGEIPEFTGISSPYEPPDNPDLVIDTSQCIVEDAVNQVIRMMEEKHKRMT